MREFTTPDGMECRAWQVTPANLRRVYARERERERRGQDVLLYKGPERRKAERRRRTLPAGVSIVPPTMDRGWLALECNGVKRRIAPPPPDWERASDAELVRMWARASGGQNAG